MTTEAMMPATAPFPAAGPTLALLVERLVTAWAELDGPMT
jgi:hypothetical protein